MLQLTGPQVGERKFPMPFAGVAQKKWGKSAAREGERTPVAKAQETSRRTKRVSQGPRACSQAIIFLR